MKKLFLALLVLALSCTAFAQSPASNKAFFTHGGGLDLSAVNQKCSDSFGGETLCSAWTDLFDVKGVIKTSSVGAIEAAVSMECALWTYNTVTAVSNQGKQTSSSRAGVEVQVLIDGKSAVPGQVVYCDRVQATGLQVDTVCSCTVTDPITGAPLPCSCEVTDTITLELFQRTKNANSFHYYLGPLPPVLHDVTVKARGIVECFSNGTAIDCPKAILDAYKDAKTAAAIGKATLVLEEHNNFGEK